MCCDGDVKVVDADVIIHSMNITSGFISFRLPYQEFKYGVPDIQLSVVSGNASAIFVCVLTEGKNQVVCVFMWCAANVTIFSLFLLLLLRLNSEKHVCCSPQIDYERERERKRERERERERERWVTLHHCVILCCNFL